MPISFPSSPSVDDIYTYNGAKYIWDGVKWVSGGQNAYIVQGEDAVLGATQVASLNGGQLAGFRNKIINGDFRFWQRGSSGFTNSEYAADRWYVNANFTAAGRINNNGPAGFTYGHSGTCSGGGDSDFRQAIELPGDAGSTHTGKVGPFAAGSQWTLSVWCEEAPTFRARWSDSITQGDSADAATSAVMTSTGETSNGYTRYAHTFTINATAPTATQDCLVISFRFSGKSSGDVVRIWGAQLEPGPVATPFEHRPYGTELALCQRYFQLVGAGIGYKKYSSRMRPLCGMIFPVEMRTTPTAALISPTPSSNFLPLVNITGTSGGGTSNVALSEISSIASISASSSGLVRLNLVMNNLALFDDTTTYGSTVDFAQLDAEL